MYVQRLKWALLVTVGLDEGQVIVSASVDRGGRFPIPSNLNSNFAT